MIQLDDIEDLRVEHYHNYTYVAYLRDDSWYDLFEDPSEEVCELIVKLLKEYLSTQIIKKKDTKELLDYLVPRLLYFKPRMLSVIEVTTAIENEDYTKTISCIESICNYYMFDKRTEEVDAAVDRKNNLIKYLKDATNQN